MIDKGRSLVSKTVDLDRYLTPYLIRTKEKRKKRRKSRKFRNKKQRHHNHHNSNNHKNKNHNRQHHHEHHQELQLHKLNQLLIFQYNQHQMIQFRNQFHNQFHNRHQNHLAMRLHNSQPCHQEHQRLQKNQNYRLNPRPQ